MDVGHLRKSIMPIRVRKPKFSEAYPEAAIKKGADELTLRADGVGTLQAFININHIEYDRWWPLLVLQTGMPPAKQSTKEFKGKKSCTVTTER